MTKSSLQRHRRVIIQPPSIAPIFPVLIHQLLWPMSRRYILSHLHLSKVEGPCIRPPPVELDGIGGILKRAMRSHTDDRQGRGQSATPYHQTTRYFGEESCSRRSYLVRGHRSLRADVCQALSQRSRAGINPLLIQSQNKIADYL